MARRTIRIPIPAGKPDDLIKLAESIGTKHTELAANSPLDDAVADFLAASADTARKNRAEAARLTAQADALNQSAATLIGVGPGQGAETPETILFHITGIRDQLLTKHRGAEEALGDYGYQVIIGTAKTPGPRKAKTTG